MILGQRSAIGAVGKLKYLIQIKFNGNSEKEKPTFGIVLLFLQMDASQRFTTTSDKNYFFIQTHRRSEEMSIETFMTSIISIGLLFINLKEIEYNKTK